jgi:hypothetical protein
VDPGVGDGVTHVGAVVDAALQVRQHAVLPSGGPHLGHPTEQTRRELPQADVEERAAALPDAAHPVAVDGRAQDVRLVLVAGTERHHVGRRMPRHRVDHRGRREQVGLPGEHGRGRFGSTVAATLKAWPVPNRSRCST